MLNGYSRIVTLAIFMVVTFILSSCALNEAPSSADALGENLNADINERKRWNAGNNIGLVDDNWLASFSDAKLNVLVDELLANNKNLQAAAAQVDAAAAAARQAGAELKPSVGLAASHSSTNTNSLLADPIDSSSAFLNVSWELDVWGRIRTGRAAAEAGFEAQQADYEFAKQSLVAQFAKTWFLATQVKLQKNLAEEAVAIYQQLLGLVSVQAELGSAKPQDLPLARANVAGAKNNLRQISASYQEVMRSLEVQLGRYPAADLNAASEYATMPPPVPAGLPAEILERRPDLVAVERRLSAAFYGVEQAKAARMPRLSLTASVGGIDSGLADLLGSSNPIESLGAGLFAPLYTGGALQAGVEIADANKRAAMADYGRRVLSAFKEVESALTNEQALFERESYILDVLNNQQEAYEITKTQYELGSIDLLSLLQTQASLLSVKSSVIAIQNERLAQRVSLHLALGGSFLKMESNK